MGGVGEEFENGKIPGRHPPEAGAGLAGHGRFRIGNGPLHAGGDPQQFFKKRQPPPGDGGAEPFRVVVFGADYRDGEAFLQDGGDVEGGVALARPRVDHDGVEFEVEGVDHHGAEDGAVDPGHQLARRLEIRLDQHGVEVEDGDLAFVQETDHLERRHADDPHPAAGGKGGRPVLGAAAGLLVRTEAHGLFTPLTGPGGE